MVHWCYELYRLCYTVSYIAWRKAAVQHYSAVLRPCQDISQAVIPNGRIRWLLLLTQSLCFLAQFYRLKTFKKISIKFWKLLFLEYLIFFFCPKDTKTQREVLNSTKTHLKVNHHQWKSFSSIGNLKITAINEKTHFIAKSHWGVPSVFFHYSVS